MFKKPNCPVIALEEHYWDAELSKQFTGPEAGRGGEAEKRLFDLGALRIKEMDEAGIDMQVLSHGAPSAQKLADGHRGRADARRQRPARTPPSRRTRRASPPSPRCRPPIRRRPPTSSSAASPSSASRAP